MTAASPFRRTACPSSSRSTTREDNIAPLVKRVHEALAGYQHPWELVLVDDGSSDATVDRAMQCVREYGPHVRVVELTHNYKQTAAMQAGLDGRAAT